MMLYPYLVTVVFRQLYDINQYNIRKPCRADYSTGIILLLQNKYCFKSQLRLLQ